MVAGLQVADAVVRYGPVTAVDRVSLEVAPGEVVALLGASGSGKSSLLRAVAGLEPLAAGAVRWDGEDLAGVPVHRRGFVVMFQDGQLFPHLSVAANVGYALDGRPRAERDARVADLLDLVGLPGYGPRPVTALSGGQAQRVALARSLAAEPRLLLLDEPLLGLSPLMQQAVMEAIVNLKQHYGLTVVLSEQFARPVLPVIDRGYVVENGMLALSGTGPELMENPEIKSAYFGI